MNTRMLAAMMDVVGQLSELAERLDDENADQAATLRALVAWLRCLLEPEPGPDPRD